MTIEEKIELVLEKKEKEKVRQNFKNFYLIASFLIMFGGLFATYRLVGFPQSLNLFATASTTPTNIQITQVSSSGFTITWTTEGESTGYLQYGKTLNSKDKIAYDIKAAGKDKKAFQTTRHQVSVNSAEANQLYFYSIYSQGREYSASEGSIFTPIKTLTDAADLTPAPEGSSPPKSGFADLLSP